MNETLIDELYELYKNYFGKKEREQSAEIDDRLKNFNKDDVKSYIRSFLTQKASSIGSQFKSFQQSENSNKILNGIRNDLYTFAWKIDNIKLAYKDAYHPLNHLLLGVFTEEEIEELKNNYVFSLSPSLLDKIHETNMNHDNYAYGIVTDLKEENYQRLKSFIDAVNKKDLIAKLFRDKKHNPIDIIPVLIDRIKIENKNKPLPFNALSEDNSFSEKYLELHLDKLSLFKQYDSNMISDKTLFDDLEKMAFLRNLYIYLDTGVYINKNATHMSPFPKDEIKSEASSLLHDIYNNFNSEEFVKMQKNYILTPAIPSGFDTEIYDYAYSINDNTASIGMLVETKPFDELGFISMEISGTGENLKYEIQYNMLLKNKLDERIQLFRLDNYTQVGQHKNIGGVKLPTKTHIHIYNQLDLIRGKANGGFDIAYNIENGNMPFTDALNIFFNIFEFNDELKEDIKEKVNEVMQATRRQSTSR